MGRAGPPVETGLPRAAFLASCGSGPLEPVPPVETTPAASAGALVSTEGRGQGQRGLRLGKAGRVAFTLLRGAVSAPALCPGPHQHSLEEPWLTAPEARDNAQSRAAWSTWWLGPGPGPGGSRQARALGVGPWRGAQDTGDGPQSLPSAPCPTPAGVLGLAGCPGFPLRKPPPGPAGGGLWELMEGAPGEAVGVLWGLLLDEHPAAAGGGPGAWGAQLRAERSWWGDPRGQPVVLMPVMSCGLREVSCWSPGARLRAGGQRAPSPWHPHPMPLELPSWCT